MDHIWIRSISVFHDAHLYKSRFIEFIIPEFSLFFNPINRKTARIARSKRAAGIIVIRPPLFPTTTRVYGKESAATQHLDFPLFLPLLFQYDMKSLFCPGRQKRLSLCIKLPKRYIFELKLPKRYTLFTLENRNLSVWHLFVEFMKQTDRSLSDRISVVIWFSPDTVHGSHLWQHSFP